ncbi:four helix bundle protein [Pelagicoccus sp. SDUM812002]|uniref:four helix bundle protein n=1 Tax=Pelagicoccus sp. SDUM812002 TaxID=3041266 RepID=UPI0031F33496
MESQPLGIQERTFAFAIRVVGLCDSLNSEPGVSRTLSNQLLRSGTSIGANVEEAHGSQSKADFTAKMYIACKEARESLYWLRLLIATNVVSKSKLQPLTDEANELVAILTTIVKKTKSS